MTAWQYLVLAGLGAFHGLNPGMGWLVSLAAGVRERSRVAVLRTLAPIAGGHAMSVFAAALLVGVLRSIAATQAVAITGGVALLALGVWRTRSRRHDHANGLRLTNAQLVGWSFVMSSVDGAGLALIPILVAAPSTSRTAPVDVLAAGGHVHAGVVAHVGVSLWTGLAATTVHTVAMVAAAAIVAFVALELTGSRIRRWLRLDRVWTVALITSGCLTLLLSLISWVL